MIEWYILGLVALTLFIVLALFSRAEAIRLVNNPGGGPRPAFRHYLMGVVIVLEHSVLLLITVPLALIKKLRGR